MVVGNEAAKLRSDLERYRYLLDMMTDPKTRRVLNELMAEAEARLAKLMAFPA
jgi:hypothetical protein